MAALSLTACRQNDSLVESDSSFNMQSSSAEYVSECSNPVQTVSGNINSSNNHWTAGTVWEIDGVVNVPNGVTLTIDAGTFIKAKPHADGSATGVLVVQKGGTLNANGTASAPVVFTSYKLLDCNPATKAAPGDFGGVVILGDAPINTASGTATIEGLSGSQYEYGGSNSSHNGGSLTYVRIEFAGYELPTEVGSGNEINGLTLGGVGSGTKLDHIQVSYGKDDSFEFFGGTVNATNLISYAADDDNFDFDNGYVGHITCALALADTNSTHSTSGGSPDSNGIELDNNATGTATTLLTHPVIDGLTIIGAGSSTQGAAYENGIHVRRNGKLDLTNSVVVGYPMAIKVEGTGSELLSSNYGSIKVHGFNNPPVSGPNTNSIPPANILSGSISLPIFGMSQPFFNAGSVNIGDRNCGNFFDSWTNYDFITEK